MKLIIALALVLVSACPVLAADCSADFFGGKQPKATGTLKVDQTLCFDEFAVGYSDITLTPLWSAEGLTAAQLKNTAPRVDAFHPESLLPAADRSAITDYARSGYDKGHMTPAGDEATAIAERQSFSLGNMVPQNPKLNRGLWARIEKVVRLFAVSEGTVYVVTGPIFKGTGAVPDGRVRIPAYTFKAVYDPASKIAGAYVATNDNSRTFQEMSIAALNKLAGLNLFPALPGSIAKTLGAIPAL